VEGGDPFARREAKAVESDSGVVRGQVAQAEQSGFEEGAGAEPIAMLIVMKRGGNLNDSLKKPFFRAGGSEPNFFPGLVGLEEAFGIELFQSPPETFVSL
jgi:hypothetical protein